jgi:hypothetical protein
MDRIGQGGGRNVYVPCFEPWMRDGFCLKNSRTLVGNILFLKASAQFIAAYIKTVLTR